MARPLTTVTFAVPLTTPATLELAVMMADPVVEPAVTGTAAVVAPCAILTLEGTAATALLLDCRVTVIPPTGAGPESVSVRVCEAPTASVMLPGWKERFAATCTLFVSPAKPVAEAVMFAVPIFTPVIWAETSGAVAPSLMKTDGVTVRRGSLLTRFTVTPPTGAGVISVTPKLTVWPTPTTAPLCREIAPRDVTVMVRVSPGP